MISTVIWEKFREGTGFADPLLVHFPAYNKQDALAILEQRAPADVPTSHFRQFVSLLWDVFHGPCRDLNELGHLVSLFFDKYYQPVRAGDISGDNKSALFKHISPLLRTHFSSLYLRQTSTTDWLEAADDGASTVTQVSTQLRKGGPPGRKGSRRREAERRGEGESMARKLACNPPAGAATYC